MTALIARKTPAVQSLAPRDEGDDERLTRGVLRGGGVGLAARAAYTLFQLASHLLMARLMGPRDYGVVQVGLTCAIILAAVSQLGLHRIPTVVASGRWRGEDAWHSARAIRFALRWTLALGVLVVAAAWWVVSPALAWLGAPDVAKVLQLLAPVILLHNLAGLGSATGLSAGKVTGEVWGLKITQPLCLLGWLVIVSSRLDGAELLQSVSVGIAISWVVGATFAWAPQVRMLGRARKDVGPYAAVVGERGEWLSAALASYASDLSYKARGLLDILAVGIFIGGDTAGLYTLASRLAGLLSAVLESFNGLTAYSVASLLRRGDRTQIPFVFRKITLSVLGIVILPAGILLGGGSEALGLFGPVFAAGAPFLFVLVIGHVASAAVGPTEYFLLATGRQKVLAHIGLAALLMSVFTLPVFSYFWGALGLAVAASLSLMAHNLLQVFALRGDELFAWRKKEFIARVLVLGLVALISAAFSVGRPSFLIVSAILSLAVGLWLTLGWGRRGTLWGGA